MPESSGASLAERPYLECRIQTYPDGKKSAGGSVSNSFADARKKGGCGGWHSWCVTVTASSSTTSLVVMVSMLSHFRNQWRNITSNRFVLNMVQGHHLQLRSCPPLFCNFQLFNVKAAAAHHPIIQKEVDELLAKGAIEPSSGGASFYSSMLFLSILMVTDPYITLSNWIIICIYILLGCLLWDMSDSLFSMVIMLSPLTSRMLIYIFLLLSVIIHFCNLFGTICPISGMFFGLVTVPRVFTALAKPILFLCHCKGFSVVIYLDNILVLVCCELAGKSAVSFLCSLLVHLELHINFSKSELCHTQTFLGYVWILYICQYLCLLIS